MSEDAKGISDDRKSSSASSDGKKVTIKSADMKEDLQKEAIRIAIGAFEKHGVEKDVAEYIKKEFDKKHGPTWHCIVGKNFGGRSAPVEMDRFLDSDEFDVAFDVDHPSYANIFEDA